MKNRADCKCNRCGRIWNLVDGKWQFKEFVSEKENVK